MNAALGVKKGEARAFFHNLLPRENVRMLLKKSGDFLIRKSVLDGWSVFVLSFLWNGQVFHMVVQKTRAGKYKVENPKKEFDNISGLISFYKKNKGVPMSQELAKKIRLKRQVGIQKWQLTTDEVKFGPQRLGSGQFGNVLMGHVGMIGNKSLITVAIKHSRVNATWGEGHSMIKEAERVVGYRHPNVVIFYGMLTQPIAIVMEFAGHGSLRDYLHWNKMSIGYRPRVKFCLDAAKGMEYLAKKGCVHSDLAARNCLLGENCVLKISDFAFIGIIGGEKKFPVKWMAPETMLLGKHSTQTDVWSYGIVIWEIFSDARTPYPDLTNEEVIKEVPQGTRMQPPIMTPKTIVDLMKKCWTQKAKERPSFSKIRRQLEKTYQKFYP